MEGAGFEVLRPDYGPVKISLEEHIPAGADIVLLNTCSVREFAEDKVYSHIGLFGRAKRTNPKLVVGLMGCMVEEHKEKLFRRFPQLDLMVGTRNIKELPALVEDVLTHRRQVAKIKQDGISIEYTDQIKRRGTGHAWLPVMTGCNKVCTFCIVPITRGSEVSMPAREVYREASRLVADGVRWITLLGQNVNSYNGAPENQDTSRISFPELLEMLCQIEGLERISFTTSHPHDATEELFQVIRRNPKISRHFHLPLQSGSDRVLKRMKRLHTFAEYKEKIDRMRALIPGVSVTTDIIAGFCGETDEDHADTERALQTLRFDGAFIYKYSVRPGTPAAKLTDDVPLPVKKTRNAALLAIQDAITDENNARFLGATRTVFVDALSTKDKAQLVGCAEDERKVVFPGEKDLIGKFLPVEFCELRHDTYIGRLASVPV